MVRYETLKIITQLFVMVLNDYCRLMYTFRNEFDPNVATKSVKVFGVVRL